ncbi:hypothetical protein [Stappia stellulata]|uniref:hypothetical protein n=1 Tax=Stappia stellulata TaxID=71235 RepID=UPI0003F8C484|nr:hypothetical protein [Stappia stellulata]
MTVLLQWLTGPLLRAVLTHFDRRVAARSESERLSADLAARSIRAEMEARGHARAVLLAEQGRFWTAARLGRLMFVVPLGIWWSAVIADSIFAFAWSVAALPSPLDEWAGAILLSLFLVDGLQGAVRATRARPGSGPEA